MPAKAGKDFVAHNLTRVIKALAQSDSPPPTKRQKVEGTQKMEEVGALSKSKELLIGLNKVQKALTSASDQDKEQLIVFIMND